MRRASSREGTITREQAQRKPKTPLEAQGRPGPAGQKQNRESAKETREILVSEAEHEGGREHATVRQTDNK